MNNTNNMNRYSLLSQMVVENKISYKECEYLNNHPEAPIPGEEGYIQHFDKSGSPVEAGAVHKAEASQDSESISNDNSLDQNPLNKTKPVSSKRGTSRKRHKRDDADDDIQAEDFFAQKMERLNSVSATISKEIYDEARKRGMETEDIMARVKKFKLPRSARQEIRRLDKMRKMKEREAKMKAKPKTQQVSFYMYEKTYCAVKDLCRKTGSNMTRFLNEAALDKYLEETRPNDDNNTSI